LLAVAVVVLVLVVMTVVAVAVELVDMFLVVDLYPVVHILSQ
jgi:hypothetical protein